MEQIGDAFVSEKTRTEWENKTKQIRDVVKGRKKEMKIVKERKLKHAIEVHKEGRIFVENCLLEKGEMQNSAIKKKKGNGSIDSRSSKSKDSTSCGGNKTKEHSRSSGTPNEAGDSGGEVNGVRNTMGVSTVEAGGESGVSGKQNIGVEMEETSNAVNGKQNSGETENAGNAGRSREVENSKKVEMAGTARNAERAGTEGKAGSDNR